MNADLNSDKAAKLLKMILGRNVTTIEITARPTTPSDTSVVAVYTSPAGDLAGACVCDCALAAYAGAALSLIPVATASESVRAGKLEPMLLENFREVFNIASQLFTSCSTDRVILGSVRLMAELKVADLNPPDAEIKKLINTPSQRLEMEVSVEGYGDGQMYVFR